MTLTWHHDTITSVRADPFNNWIIGCSEADGCGWCVFVPRELQPVAPPLGDTISTIAIGSRVISCAIGEKLLWDERREP